MKIKFVLLGVLLSVVSISCKDDKKNEVQQDKKMVDPKELFNVELNLIVSKDDSLQLFYKDDSNNDWQDEKSVWAPVKGDVNAQKVQFFLPKDIIPNDLRIDFGNNKNQKSIEVKNFTMKYFNKTFTVKDTMFYQFFQPNEQINWDRKKATANFNYKQGIYDPLFFPRETLKGEILKIVK